MWWCSLEKKSLRVMARNQNERKLGGQFTLILIAVLVAGAGFEPATFWL